jgi:integral membrane sensor domain MASE1
MTRAAPVVSIPAHASAAASAPWIGPLALTALAYAAAGLLALPLAVPPHQAPLVGVAAGVALASVLVHGWRMLGGVAAGALALQLAIGASRGEPAALLVALAIALAAALQAAAGAALVRRFVDRPLTLAAPRDIAAFFACCAASSVVGATLASLALRSAAMVAPADGAASWAAWWIGDLAGLLVATPMVLTLIGRPRAEWAPRRLAVGLTLALTMLILALAVEETTRRTGAQSTAWMVAAIGVACAGALAALLLATTARARALKPALC